MPKLDIPPIIRNMLACEDIQTDPQDARKVSLVNLIHSIKSVEEPPYPLRYRELCVFVQLTECRGKGRVGLTISHADSGASAYDGPAHPWQANLPNAPLQLVGLPFRLTNIEFPEPGLYLIEFWYNDKVLGEQPLLLR